MPHPENIPRGSELAELRVDSAAIRQNAAAVASLLEPLSIGLVGVTKGCLGDPRVAKAMIDGGATGICDTRDANLRRLCAALPEAFIQRIYLPSLSRPFAAADLCVVASREGVEAVARNLRREAAATGGEPTPRSFPQQVSIMVESGDLREGVPAEDAEELAELIAATECLELTAVATNYACFAGTPSGLEASLQVVAGAADRLRRSGHDVCRVSGGNSSVLALVMGGTEIPDAITELRCGEALLLGHEPLRCRPVPKARQDACLLWAEVRERYTKAVGAGSEDRVVLALGGQDLGEGAVRFMNPDLEEIGRSSDYLVAKAGSPGPAVGDWVPMVPDYRALVAAWTSPYVEVTCD